MAKGFLELANGFSSLLRVSIALSLVLVASPVYALGLGSAAAESYIGQPLLISVPVINGADSNDLEVKLSSLSLDNTGGSLLKSRIERANNALMIKVFSTENIGEPYFSFTLELSDQQQTLSKEFTVLLDLAPAENAALVGRQSDIAQPVASTSAKIKTAPIVRGDGSVLGPYDWAEKGNIPARFGAVIDGQSLWRVARRINKAMGVSINQMMWSLYSQNPAAFSNGSIDSLRAGSYLDIPSYAIASQLSDAQARERMQSQRVVRADKEPTPVVEAPPAPKEPEPADTELIENELVEQSLPADQAFQFDIGRVVLSEEKQTPTSVSDNAASFGEEQALESDLNNTVVADQQASVNQAPLTSDQRPQQSEIAAEDTVAATAVSSESVPESTTDDSAIDTAPLVESDSSSTASWLWLLVPLGLVVGFVFRERLFAKPRDLDLLDTRPWTRIESNAGNQPSTANQPSTDFSVMSAIKKAMEEDDDEELVEGITYYDLEDLDKDELTISDFGVAEYQHEEYLDFDQRFSGLIKDKDFQFARELLDFARHNQIDDQRYHCERLRLYREMGDESGFYDYYHEIESKIPTFDTNLQNQISDYVVQLASPL